MKSLLEILQQSAAYLARHESLSPRVEAEWLLAHALGERNRLQLYLQFERPLGEDELAVFRPLLRRRAAGEPLSYILGTAAFMDLELDVGPGVLSPRPETELLVDLALRHGAKEASEILDLCTGSGAILLALAKALDAPLPGLTGVDLSSEALVWARRNAEKLGLSHLRWLEGDLLAPVQGRRFDLITVNPPYVSAAEFKALPRDVRDYEPAQALYGGKDGLDFYRRLALEGLAHLTPGGWLIGEIGETQGAAVVGLFEEGGFCSLQLKKDLNRRDRFILAQCPAV